MSKELKFLCLDPDGTFRWIHTTRKRLLDDFYAAIGCDCVEHVRLPFNFGCVVDESGKIKSVPQPVNPYASRLYPGSPYGDPLVGPVIFVRIDLVDGEPDWCPLHSFQIPLLERLLGLEVPTDE